MDKVQDFLKANGADDIVHQNILDEASVKFNVPPDVIEEAALNANLLPARYQRNRNTLSIEQQYALFKSRVVVIGCGGLGGHVIEGLARLGVGTIVAVDPDHFEEHNLNRQILCTLETLGQLKTAAAADRVRKINPAITIVSVPHALRSDNAARILSGCDVAVDALDSITVRVELARACAELLIPLVHGAIAGWFGQIAIQLPREQTVLDLLEKCGDKIGIEKVTGNPSFAPAVVAGLQAAEACKIITNKDSSMKGRILFIDLLDMHFEEIRFE
jgi:molybdopterin/thiamine biosynthesis adenylyltransferase